MEGWACIRELDNFYLSRSNNNFKFPCFNPTCFRIRYCHSLIFQLNILPLIWSRDGPLFFSSFVRGIQFQSQLIVRRYPTNICQDKIKKGWFKWGAKSLSFISYYPNQFKWVTRVHELIIDAKALDPELFVGSKEKRPTLYLYILVVIFLNSYAF